MKKLLMAIFMACFLMPGPAGAATGVTQIDALAPFTIESGDVTQNGNDATLRNCTVISEGREIGRIGEIRIEGMTEAGIGSLLLSDLNLPGIDAGKLEYRDIKGDPVLFLNAAFSLEPVSEETMLALRDFVIGSSSARDVNVSEDNLSFSVEEVESSAATLAATGKTRLSGLTVHKKNLRVLTAAEAGFNGLSLPFLATLASRDPKAWNDRVDGQILASGIDGLYIRNITIEPIGAKIGEVTLSYAGGDEAGKGDVAVKNASLPGSFLQEMGFLKGPEKIVADLSGTLSAKNGSGLETAMKIRAPKLVDMDLELSGVLLKGTLKFRSLVLRMADHGLVAILPNALKTAILTSASNEYPGVKGPLSRFLDTPGQKFSANVSEDADGVSVQISETGPLD